MTDTEFIDFMGELVLAPDTVIKKAYMERMLKIVKELEAKYKSELAVNREIENLYVQQGAIYEGISELIRDGRTSDFMMSFPIVSQVADLVSEIALKQSCIDGARRQHQDENAALQSRIKELEGSTLLPEHREQVAK